MVARRRSLVIVANRLPVRPSNSADGWERSPGGLVTALEPVASHHHTAWVGWTGEPGAQPDPFELDGLALHPVTLPDHLVDDFYNGFSNGTLWPLYHDAIFVPQFHDHWWDAYRTVNDCYADAVAAMAPRGAVVWVHDYQLQLVPQLLRDRRPDLHIGFFLHIPFPAQELYLRIPWRAELTRGMLGADVVGFQTMVGAQNFRQVARRLLGTRTNGKWVESDTHRTLVDTYPVGIDAGRVSQLAAHPTTGSRAAQLRVELGRPRTILLGVDRLDYTKGIEVRMRAYRELLEEGRLDPKEAVLVQIAQPSRDEVPGYAEIRNQVEQMAGAINGDFAHFDRVAVKYLHQSQPFSELVALYRAADVMLVTPFRDGMNLVAKEYVASRVDRSGVLVLSEFAGAAHQLHEATLVNPFDVRSVKDAIDRAVHGDAAQQRKAMAALWRRVHEHDAAGWANDFLAAMDLAA